jgi:hypothetical protein
MKLITAILLALTLVTIAYNADAITEQPPKQERGSGR